MTMTMAGIEWEAPSNFPTDCFSQYIISIVDDSNIELIVNGGTVASFDDLREANFTLCKTITIHVSPMLNGMPVEDSSVTVDVYLDAGMYIYTCIYIYIIIIVLLLRFSLLKFED